MGRGMLAHTHTHTHTCMVVSLDRQTNKQTAQTNLNWCSQHTARHRRCYPPCQSLRPEVNICMVNTLIRGGYDMADLKFCRKLNPTTFQARLTIKATNGKRTVNENECAINTQERISISFHGKRWSLLISFAFVTQWPHTHTHTHTINVTPPAY